MRAGIGRLKVIVRQCISHHKSDAIVTLANTAPVAVMLKTPTIRCFVVCWFDRCNLVMSVRSPWIIAGPLTPRGFGQHAIGRCLGQRFPCLSPFARRSRLYCVRKLRAVTFTVRGTDSGVSSDNAKPRHRSSRESPHTLETNPGGTPFRISTDDCCPRPSRSDAHDQSVKSQR